MPDRVDRGEDFSETSGADIPADWSVVTGGVFRGAASADVDLCGVDIKITKDLTIIADGTLTTDGDIEVIERARIGLSGELLAPLRVSPEPNINLVSLGGAMVVTKGSEIGLRSESQRTTPGDGGDVAPTLGAKGTPAVQAGAP